MTNDQMADSVYYGLWLMLLLSALFSRGVPDRKLATYAAIWLAIIVALWTLIMIAQRFL
jgi:predicted aspartyl protease